VCTEDNLGECGQRCHKARRGAARWGNDKEVKEEKGNSTCENKHEHKHEVEKATMKDLCNCKIMLRLQEADLGEGEFTLS